MLFAVWCLGDLERVDDLESRMRDTQRAAMLPFTEGGARNLNEERSAVLRDVQRRPTKEATGMPLDMLLTFPGFGDHLKGPVS